MKNLLTITFFIIINTIKKAYEKHMLLIKRKEVYFFLSSLSSTSRLSLRCMGGAWGLCALCLGLV
jgi:hypothetical protein